MTEQKHEKPITLRRILTAATMLGFAASVVSTACDYFIVKNNLYDSAHYGIATGVGMASYTSTALFLSPEEEYIDDKLMLCITLDLTL